MKAGTKREKSFLSWEQAWLIKMTNAFFNWSNMENMGMFQGYLDAKIDVKSYAGR